MADMYGRKMPFEMPGLSRESSFAGPHGGGIYYNQMAIGDGFKKISPIAGHTQASNLTIPQPLRGYLKQY